MLQHIKYTFNTKDVTWLFILTRMLAFILQASKHEEMKCILWNIKPVMSMYSMCVTYLGLLSSFLVPLGCLVDMYIPHTVLFLNPL